MEDTLKGLLNVFKEKKAAYIEAIEKEKEENLARKHAILDEIKGYIQDPDNIDKYYNDFKERQQAFKEIVNVRHRQSANCGKIFRHTARISMIC